MVRSRRLIQATLVAVVLALGACATAPSGDPRDPSVFRPTNPSYPMPER